MLYIINEPWDCLVYPERSQMGRIVCEMESAIKLLEIPSIQQTAYFFK